MTLQALHELWRRVQAGGYDAVAEVSPTDSLDAFYLALVAFHADEFDAAARLARLAAAQDPAHLVFAQAVVYLDRVVQHGKAGVYVDGEAFAAFIRGGGNVHLYAAVSAALRAVYAAYPALAVLDIGVGDGMALLPALTEAVSHVTLLEPSTVMLARTTDALRARDVAFTELNATVQQFMSQVNADARWPLIQATWSLQSVPPEERAAIFAWLRAHSDRVLIAEFDVPAFDARLPPARVQYIVDRYARGLAE
ncbi:MAG: class I SAM-dependent methyltransferase, partial [Anaerolineae bacterium]|nr:class I SAM-dependent methyltransferase [Anaerolineae bacterium]